MFSLGSICFVSIWVILATVTAQNTVCQNVLTLSRSEWESAIPPGPTEVLPAAGQIFFSQTGGRSCEYLFDCKQRVRQIQAEDRAKNKTDIGSNFLISSNGWIFEGRGWNRRNDLPNPYSTQLSIAFIGDFSQADVSKDAINAVRDFILCAVRERKIQRYFSAYSIHDLSCTLHTEDGVERTVKRWSRYGLGGPLVKC